MDHAVGVFRRQLDVLDDRIVRIVRIELAEHAAFQRDIGPGGANGGAGECRGGRRVDDNGSDVRLGLNGEAQRCCGDCRR